MDIALVKIDVLFFAIFLEDKASPLGRKDTGKREMRALHQAGTLVKPRLICICKYVVGKENFYPLPRQRLGLGIYALPVRHKLQGVYMYMA